MKGARGGQGCWLGKKEGGGGSLSTATCHRGETGGDGGRPGEHWGEVSVRKKPPGEHREMPARSPGGLSVWRLSPAEFCDFYLEQRIKMKKGVCIRFPRLGICRSRVEGPGN